MDGNNRQRKQHEPPYYVESSQRYNHDRDQGRGFGSSSAGTYRYPAETSGSSTSRRTGEGEQGGVGMAEPSGSGYGYYNDSSSSFTPTMQTDSMQYQPGYTTDQRQQSYAEYGPNLMYNMTQGATNQASVYDSTSQFHTRQPASMQLLADATQFFPGGTADGGNTSSLQHQTQSTSSGIFQQAPVQNRGSHLQDTADDSMVMSNMPRETAPVPEIAAHQQEYGTQNFDDAYTQYQSVLKSTFQNIRNGMLVEASQSLLKVSDWLLSHVNDLGLTVDNENLKTDRIRLWNEFNHAWLAMFQKQKDLTLAKLDLGAEPSVPQTMIEYEYIEKMAKELVRLCDGIDKHGLVDYQYGVWEESIIRIITECLELLDEVEGTRSGEAAMIDRQAS